MISQKDLFNEGNNPFYEAFDPKEFALLKMTLDQHKVEYNEVPHITSGANSLRFYVAEKNEHFMKEKSDEMRSLIDSGKSTAQYDYERVKYINHFKR